MTIWHDLLGLEFQVKHVDAKGIKTAHSSRVKAKMLL